MVLFMVLVLVLVREDAVLVALVEFVRVVLKDAAQMEEEAG